MEEETLKQFTTALANAIREVDGSSDPINPQDFAARILALSNGEPITGEIRIFWDDTKPASKFGGSWDETVFPYGTFLMAAGSGGTAGQTGGSNSITLKEENLPNMYGYLAERNGGWLSSGCGDVGLFVSQSVSSEYGQYPRGWFSYANEIYPAGVSKGSGQAFDNRPQNVTVHIWRKVS